MKKRIDFSFFLLFVLITASCKKDLSIAGFENYKINRVEYYDTTGMLNGGFKNLSYSGGQLTRIDMISGEWVALKYENNKVTTISNMLLGVPFPITTYKLKYSATGLLEQVVSNANDVFGQSTQNDTLSFSWIGSNLVKASSKSFKKSGELMSEEIVRYTYSGNNISKCVFEGRYYAYASPVFWKDSVEFQYDAQPNKFSENGIVFFLDEFSLINAILKKSLRISNDPYLDPFNLDPVFFSFIQSANNVVTMKSQGGNNTMQFDYIMGSGALANKIKEIRVNDRIVSHYSYKKTL